MNLLGVAAVAVRLGLLGHAQAHSSSRPPVVDANADWATKHMAEEHHIGSFDAGSFFSLHDYNSDNEWDVLDVMKTYGGMDKSTDHISQAEKERKIRPVIDLYDGDHSGTVSFAEYVAGVARGVKLPDIGWGPGHHGDDEYEYEIHHWEKYHDENTKEEDLTHPEDIEHFRMHDQREAAHERQERLDRMSIVEANIPSKFRNDL